MAPDATAATIAAITTVIVAGYSLQGLPHRTQTPALHILPFTYWFSELPGQALSSACLPMAASPSAWVVMSRRESLGFCTVEGRNIATAERFAITRKLY